MKPQNAHWGVSLNWFSIESGCLMREECDIDQLDYPNHLGMRPSYIYQSPGYISCKWQTSPLSVFPQELKNICETEKVADEPWPQWWQWCPQLTGSSRRARSAPWLEGPRVPGGDSNMSFNSECHPFNPLIQKEFRIWLLDNCAIFDVPGHLVWGGATPPYVHQDLQLRGMWWESHQLTA